MPTIGYDPEFAPITFAGTAGGAGGSAIRLLEAACERAGVVCRFAPVDLPEQEHALSEGRIDAIAVMAATPERRRRFDLSEPYLVTGAAWFALQTAASNPFDPVAHPARVATPASGPLVRIVTERWPHLAIVPVAGYREALAAVAAGEVAAAALNADVGRSLCEARYPGIFALPDRPFLELPLALACRKGSRDEALARLFAALGWPDPDLST